MSGEEAVRGERITSRQNPAIQHMVRLLADRGFRREHGEVAAEGVKLLADAVAGGAALCCVICAEGAEPPPLAGDVRLITVPERLFAAISTQKGPQGVLFSCKKPRPVTPEHSRGAMVLDGVQDPGNVGTAIRTALALGIGQVLLSGGCADPYAPKTIRASMGAVFRLPVAEGTPAEVTELLRERGLAPAAAMPSDGAADVREMDWTRVAPVIGSEGGGIGTEMRALCEAAFTIPMAAGAESLNAAMAAGIVMWEMARGGPCGTL